MAYKAIIARVQTRPHPNADRLQLGLVLGNQVVVGLDTQNNELGVFFPTDGQLSLEMCQANDLLARKDETGKKVGGGYFDDNRRVRAQKFRKERSDGFFMPLASLAWTGYDLSKLAEGTAFDTLNGKVVCAKYVTARTRNRQMAGSVKVRRDNKLFAKHEETDQFRYYARDIKAGSLLYITEKLHGTSGRMGHVLEEVRLPWWKQLLAFFLTGSATWREHRVLHGSRNVVLDDEKPGFYGDHTFRYNAVRNVWLHKGEVIYFEIVGWVNDTTPIMSPQPIKDAEVAKQFGKEMTYAYLQAKGTQKAYVYRITRVNEDGIVTELPWAAMVDRCRELGLAHVPLLYGPVIYDGSEDKLRTIVETYTEGTSTLDASHIREGVVVRIEDPSGRVSHLKNKSFTFGVLEGYIKDSDTYVDTEEVA